MKLLRSFTAVVTIGLGVVLQSNVANAAGDITNGSSCFAANLAQATELSWNQARVLNPADNPNTRFVVCNITTGPKIASTGPTVLTLANSGSVGAFFDEDADPSEPVSCVIREIGNAQTGNAGLDQIIVDINPPADLPGTATGGFGADDGIGAFINIFSVNSVRSITFTCALPPGTGIQQLLVLQTLADG